MFLRFLATPMLSIKNEGKYVGKFDLRGKDFKTQSVAFPQIVWKKKKKDFYRNDAFSENQGLIRKTYATFGETERSLSL